MQQRQGPGLNSYPCSAPSVAPYVLGLGLSSSWMCWAVCLCHRLGDLPPSHCREALFTLEGEVPKVLVHRGTP